MYVETRLCSSFGRFSDFEAFAVDGSGFRKDF